MKINFPKTKCYHLSVMLLSIGKSESERRVGVNSHISFTSLLSELFLFRKIILSVKFSLQTKITFSIEIRVFCWLESRDYGLRIINREAPRYTMLHVQLSNVVGERAPINFPFR